MEAAATSLKCMSRSVSRIIMVQFAAAIVHACTTTESEFSSACAISTQGKIRSRARN